MSNRAHNFKDLTGQVFGRLTVTSFDKECEDSKGKNISKWNCMCDCGNEVSVFGKYLIHKTTRSCGCLRKDVSRELLQGNQLGRGRTDSRKEGRTYSWRKFYNQNKRNAEVRGYSWNLTEEQVKAIAVQNCYICGEKPQKRLSGSNDYRYRCHKSGVKLDEKYVEERIIYANGLDRVDNDIGYEIGNVAPCCSTCNYIKKSHGLEALLEHLTKMVVGLEVQVEKSKKTSPRLPSAR